MNKDYQVSKLSKQLATAIKDYTGIKDLSLYNYDISFVETDLDTIQLRNLISKAFKELE